MTKTLALLLAASLAAAACDPGGGTPPPDGTLALEPERSQALREGDRVALYATVRDAGGQTVSGAVVRFEVKEGGGTLVSTSVTTDEAGRAATELVLGPVAGANVVEARSERAAHPATLSLTVEPLRLSLGADSLVLGVASCYAQYEAVVRRGSEPQMLGIPVEWTLVGPQGLVYIGEDLVSGNYRPLRRWVQPHVPMQAGSVLLVASYQGAADTVAIRLAPEGPRYLEVGDGSGSYLLRLDQTPIDLNPWRGGDCERLDAAPSYVVDHPGVVSVDAENRLHLLSAGSARVVASQGALADTLDVQVRDLRVSPADTTVYVGDAFTYRLSVARTAGNHQPAAITDANVAQLPDNVIAEITKSGVLTARAPGEVVVNVQGDGLWARATLKVLPRP